MIKKLTAKELFDISGAESEQLHYSCTPFDPVQTMLTGVITCLGTAAAGNALLGLPGAVAGFTACMAYSAENVYFHYTNDYSKRPTNPTL